jgi:RND family efflux transporter MFP subunit
MLLTSCHYGNKIDTDMVPETKRTEAASKEDRSIPVVRATLFRLKNKIDVPGELTAFQNVAVHAKVQGFISSITVDRGSWVKKGQKLITIYCPELVEKINEAEAKVSAAEAVVTRAQASLQNVKAQLVESQAKLDADTLTYERIKEASHTPGAVALNDVDVAEKKVEGDKATVAASKAAIGGAAAVVVAEQKNVSAEVSVLHSLQAMRSYLTIEAPFDGVVSSRNVHEGSIVAVDPAHSAKPLIRVQQMSPLRLVAAIPEDAVGSLHMGAKIKFTVPAYPGKEFVGLVARPAFSLDPSTRTMPVELSVPNVPRVLDPGMYCNVEWTVSRPYKTVFLPSSAVGTDLVGSFVNKIENGKVTRVTVRKGDQMGDMIEIIGKINDGDEVALKASNARREGTKVSTHPATADELKQTSSESSDASTSNADRAATSDKDNTPNTAATSEKDGNADRAPTTSDIDGSAD